MKKLVVVVAMKIKMIKIKALKKSRKIKTGTCFEIFIVREFLQNLYLFYMVNNYQDLLPQTLIKYLKIISAANNWFKSQNIELFKRFFPCLEFFACVK